MRLFNHKLAIGTISVIAGAGVGLGLATYLNYRSTPPNSSLTNNQSPSSFPPIAGLQPIVNQNRNFVTTVVNKVGAAVVRIDVSNLASSKGEDRSSKSSQVPAEREERGEGSGFILDTDGRILTNAHVVAGAKQVQVTLKTGQIFTATVIGSDRVTDIAVLKIAANNLPTVQLGDSDRLIVGEWAIAIGNPVGLDNTVTLGIVSATERSSSQVGTPDKRVSFIQTDAAINPGNSGGPLLNARGQVIGINTAIRANAQGVGFAIPIATAKRIADRLVATGKVIHPYLGVQMVALTAQLKAAISKELSLSNQITAERGALVMKVIPNSPAAASGLQLGDTIVKVANREIYTPSDVQQQVDLSTIGQPLNLVINRAGELKSIEIEPQELPATTDTEE